MSVCHWHHCVPLSYTTQHRTVLITLRFILWTIPVTQILSVGGLRVYSDHLCNVCTGHQMPQARAIVELSMKVCFGIHKEARSTGTVHTSAKARLTSVAI